MLIRFAFVVALLAKQSELVEERARIKKEYQAIVEEKTQLLRQISDLTLQVKQVKGQVVYQQVEKGALALRLHVAGNVCVLYVAHVLRWLLRFQA